MEKMANITLGELSLLGLNSRKKIVEDYDEEIVIMMHERSIEMFS